ncbi:MAG: type VII toxin-antitoxin system MntA family adenylyltransferase antitoxin [Polyangiaceae bacterium]
MVSPVASPSSITEPLARAIVTWPGVRLAILFGSHARGVAHPGSDVDVAVLAPGVDPLALAAGLGRALGCVVDVVSLADPGVPLLEELVRDGVVVHEAPPGAGAQWRSRALAQLETDRPWYARMRDAWLSRVASEGLPRW